MIRIDKSKFNATQLAQYEELLAIGKADVDPKAAEEEMEDDKPAVPPKKKTTEKAEVEEVEDAKKSATPAAEVEVPDFVKAAIAKSEEFITRSEKQEQAAIAKKYAPLVESVEDLAEKLYSLKKSNPEMYETCISMMDRQIEMQEKSSLFSEIGKSAGGYSAAGGGAEAKAEAKAQEIMKSNPNMDYDTAIAKAYEDPEIMAAADAEYYKR